MLGLVTLEDVIEEIIKSEILDESDLYSEFGFCLSRLITKHVFTVSADKAIFISIFQTKRIIHI